MTHSRIPTQRELRFWRIHLALYVMVSVAAIVMGFSQEELAWSDFVPSSLLDVALTGLVLIVFIAPIVGEWNFLVQRGVSTRSFWRALFVVLVVFFALGIVMQIVMSNVFGVDSELAVDPSWLLEIVSVVLTLLQLRVLWWYVWRSDHLWSARETASA